MLHHLDQLHLQPGQWIAMLALQVASSSKSDEIAWLLVLHPQNLLRRAAEEDIDAHTLKDRPQALHQLLLQQLL
jgi:hypothetical protein